MRPLTPRTLIFGIIALLGTALVLKTVRYSDAPNISGADFTTKLTRFLNAEGWTPAPGTTAQQSSVNVLEFNKAGCTRPLRVSIVGATTGVESYLRQTYGDDIAFLQQGTVRDHPSQLRLQIAKTVAAISNSLRPQKTAISPILAIIPAPKDTPRLCEGPSKKNWSKL